MEIANSGLLESTVCENNARFEICVVNYPAPRISMLVGRHRRSRRPKHENERLFRRRLHSRCSHVPSTLNLGAGGAHQCQIFATSVIFADTGTRPGVFPPPKGRPSPPGWGKPPIQTGPSCAQPEPGPGPAEAEPGGRAGPGEAGPSWV